MQFTDIELGPHILKALDEMGYETMTPIQEQTIPHIVANNDVMGLAETGSGKTGACAIPLVNAIDTSIKAIQVLVLVPTRELALQYVQEVDEIAKHSATVPFAIYGGFDMDIQKAKINYGVHILVATPGRLIDFIWNHRLDLTHVKTVVLDEADEMLKMGFIEDVDFIMECMLQEHQTLLFSATMPNEIERLTQQYLKEPVRIQLNRDQRAPQSLIHTFQHVGRQRFDALVDYLEDGDIRQGIIFCNSRDKASDLCRDLQRRIDSVDIIHGGLDQDRRTSIFRRFRQKKIRFMIATDVAGRGLDFSHVTHVINYDFPFNAEIYTHRTGRAGRMGRKGTALTLVGNRDLRDLKRLLNANAIDAYWEGDEPDLDNIRAKRGGGGRGRNGRGRDGGGGGRSGGRGRGGRGGRRRSGEKPAAKAD
ncbi:MAG: DEAD/DEAH box helicase [Candidatus Latescibacterota bacterium]|nr:DEAD/DEAH box helicase [Candidatus Latescibacterota bacterium]